MRYLAMILSLIASPVNAIFNFGVFLFVFPFAALYALVKMAINMPFLVAAAGANFFMALLVYTPLAILGLSVTTMIQLVGSIFLFPVDIVRSLLRCLQSAYMNGFDGLVQSLNEETYQDRFCDYVGEIFDSLVQRILPEEHPAAPNIPVQPVVVPVQPVVVPVQPVVVPVEPALEIDLDDEAFVINNNAPRVGDPGGGNPLTLDEIQAARALGTVYVYVNNLIGRYEELRNNLNLVRADLPRTQEERQEAELARGQDSPLANDELLAMEITHPILFVKQYEDNNGVWRCVPRMSHITDGPNLRQAFSVQGHPRHPLSNSPTDDFLDWPRLYNERMTRFVWHRLTEQACNSQELNEIAEEVRTLIPAQAAVQGAEVEPRVLPSPLNTAAVVAPVVVHTEEEPGLNL